jgi:formylglycine-generating enzyme required for sulfatase activity
MRMKMNLVVCGRVAQALAGAIFIAVLMTGSYGEAGTTDVVVVNGVAIELVKVPSGTFVMGDSFGEGYVDERLLHKVDVESFHIGRYEVTQRQWSTVMGNNPSCFRGDDLPVENVSWDECQEFIDRLNRLAGARFRLPSEAEWEYAARSGGRKERYSGSARPDEVGWLDANSGGGTRKVGGKKANGLGIFDMTGNVWEWCAGFYRFSCGDGTAKGNGASTRRVNRGGGWSSSPRAARASNRCADNPATRMSYLGLRLAADAD